MIPDLHRMNGGAAQLGARPGLPGLFGTWNEGPSRPAPAPLASRERRAEIAGAIASAFDLPPGLTTKGTDAAAPPGAARVDEPATNSWSEVVGVTMMLHPQLPPEVEAFYEGAAGEHLAHQAGCRRKPPCHRPGTRPRPAHEMGAGLGRDRIAPARHGPVPPGGDPGHTGRRLGSARRTEAVTAPTAGPRNRGPAPAQLRTPQVRTTHDRTHLPRLRQPPQARPTPVLGLLGRPPRRRPARTGHP